MNLTPFEWLLLVFTVCTFLIVRWQQDIIRKLEKAAKAQDRINVLTAQQIDDLEEKIGWITPSPITVVETAVADDVQMKPKKVPFRFVGGDDEEDPLPGLPRRYG